MSINHSKACLCEKETPKYLKVLHHATSVFDLSIYRHQDFAQLTMESRWLNDVTSGGGLPRVTPERKKKFYEQIYKE